MKLSELRAAIRKTKGNPIVKTRLADGGPVVTLTLQKTPLLEALGAAYNDERTAETGLTFDDKTGLICSVDEEPSSHEPSSHDDQDFDLPGDSDDDFDPDLL